MMAAPPATSSWRGSPPSALPPATATRRSRRARNRRHKVLLGLRWLPLALVSVAMWPTSLGGTIAYVAVSGDSMLPSLHPGNLVVTRAQGSYQVGDVIVYAVPRGDFAQGCKVVHRIVGGDAATGFTMRGDHNSFVDPWKPRPNDVLGRVVLDIPLAGAWGMELVRPVNLGILCGSLTVMALLWPRREAGRPGAKVSGAHAIPTHRMGRRQAAESVHQSCAGAARIPSRHESSQ
jgi:signal peptidase I